MASMWTTTWIGSGILILLLIDGTTAEGPSALHSTCPETFMGLCHCGMAYSNYDGAKVQKYTVNCTNTGFTNISMLNDVPEQTEVLIFVGNTVPSLPYNILDIFKNYDRLETIDLSNNHIRFVQGKTFHKVSTVKTLILNHNDIDISQERVKPRIFSNFDSLESLHLTNAFTEKVNASEYLLSLEDIFYESDLSSLKVLHLEQNEIWSIGSNKKVFCELIALEQVMLGDNRLTDFDFTIDCLRKLRYIDLERNMISRLSEDAMNTLDEFMLRKPEFELNLKLDENPFDCDCRSSSFLQWLNKTKVTVNKWKEFNCINGYPEANRGRKFGEVKDLRCPGISSSSNNSNNKNSNKNDNSNNHNTRSRNTNIPRETLDGASYHGPHFFDGDQEEGNRHGHSSVTVGVLAFLLVFTTSLLVAVAYFQRDKMKNLLLPYWDFVTRKIGYTGLAHEEAPREVNV